MFIVCSKYDNWIVCTHTVQPQYPVAPQKKSLTSIIHTRHLPGHSTWMFFFVSETLRIVIWMAVSFGPGKNLSQGYGGSGSLTCCSRRVFTSAKEHGRELGILLEITLWCTHIYIYIRGPPAKSQKMPKLPPSETTKCKKVSAGPHVCLVSTIFNTHHAASHAYMRDA